MLGWFLRGLTSPVRTTAYPHSVDTSPGNTPGRPVNTLFTNADAANAVVAACPTQAISLQQLTAEVAAGRCVHCGVCSEGGMHWQKDYRWAVRVGRPGKLMSKAFKSSLHIRLVDAGSCDAVIQEIKQLSKPYYNMHRLGFFITPTPRHADVLLVTGPVTGHMRLALQKTYEAMPEPKWVVAVGGCAISGCVFGPSFVSAGGVADVLPVDVMVPGCPPPPLAILHALLLLTNREDELKPEALQEVMRGKS
ncbi:MAG: NADH-quinone oxidoreductase subunit NuoB [Phycisphaerae bacterium]